MRSRNKLVLLGSLYLSQGLPFGFFIQTLPVIMRDQGVSLTMIGLTYLLALPWALKFLWAPVIDRHRLFGMGRRRSWILSPQALAIFLLVLLSLLQPLEAVPVLLCVVFCINLLAATQDIATDGLAVEILSPQERGLGNGIQVAGYRVGMILGGGFLLVAFEAIGWTSSLLLMALLLSIATIPVLLHKEQEPLRRCHASKLRENPLLSYFKRPGALSWLSVLALYKLGDAFATGMLRPFLVDAGIGTGQIGWILGVAGFLAGMLGAIIGGLGIRPLGRNRALVLYGVLQAFAVSLYVLPALGIGSLPLLTLVISIEHFAGGMATVALFTLMMDQCREGSEGSDYTVQASLVVAATGVASAMSGFSAEAFGYWKHFTLSGALCLTALFVIVRFKFGRSRQLRRTGRLS